MNAAPQRTIGGVQHGSKLRVQPGRRCPRRPDRPGVRLDQVTDGLAKVLPVRAPQGQSVASWFRLACHRPRRRWIPPSGVIVALAP